MSWLRLPLRGFRGHPVHPPLTDVTVGALTLGTLATVLAWVGVAVDLLTPTAYVATLVGLVASVPTAITGLADLLDTPADSPARTTAIIHLGVMTLAVGVYLVTLLLLGPTAGAGEVRSVAAAASVGGLVLLTAGGWVGGSLVFAHGVRVEGDPDTTTGEALRPGPPA